MATEPFVIERFGGLDLLNDPMEVGSAGAVDMRNVWLPAGRIQTCPTVGSFATATRAVLRVFPHSTGLQLLASEGDGTNRTLEAFDATGTSLATTTYASASITPHAFASIGTPSASRTYAVQAGVTTRRWDGSAWSTVAGVPDGRAAAPMEFGQRLAVGCASGNPHRVAFSNAGDPETFGANDYVDIAPGDGESIAALVFWENLLFAFKNTKFAVFYGESTGLAGNPEFNYRMVDTGKGVGLKGLTYAGGACAGPDGVYFVATDGVYRTRGAEPELVSRAITPLFPYAQAAGATTIPQLSLSGYPDVSAPFGVVFASAPSSAEQGTLALMDGNWTYLDIQSNGTATGPCNFCDLRSQVIFNVADSTAIKSLDINSGPSSTLSWSYKSARYSLAGPARVAVVPESSLVGSGTVALRLDSDRYTNRSASATLGTAPAVTEGWPQSIDQEGRWLQFTLSGTGAAVVSELKHSVSSVKPAGVG